MFTLNIYDACDFVGLALVLLFSLSARFGAKGFQPICFNAVNIEKHLVHGYYVLLHYMIYQELVTLHRSDLSQPEMVLPQAFKNVEPHYGTPKNSITNGAAWSIEF